MLSKHKHLQFMDNLNTEHNSDSHFISANYSGFSDKLLKPSSITETSKSCSGIELARGISVVFAEKNSHLMLPHRDVSLQFTEVLRFGKSYSSSMASKDSSTDADSQESTPRAMKIPPSDLRKSKRTQMRSVIIPYALDEIWSSEEYTCVVVHGDDHKPAVTHIFCDYILEYCHPKWMVGRKIIPTKNPVFPPTVHQYSSDNDNNLCSTCNQRLKKEEDIYMFQGEAFCSPLCRNHSVINKLWAEEWASPL